VTTPTTATRTASNGTSHELKRWRHDDIDPLKLPVMAYELGELRRDVQAMKRAFYTFAFSVVLAAVTFAFSVFALLGK
jgi:hypothetical protein